jgi:hypothetical protein
LTSAIAQVSASRMRAPRVRGSTPREATPPLDQVAFAQDESDGQLSMISCLN